MIERVHHNYFYAFSEDDEQTTSSDEITTPRPPPRPVHLSESYNVRLYKNYTLREYRRRRCRRLFCWFIFALICLAVLSAITACVFYLILRLEKPNYSIELVSVKGMNLTSSLSAISPEFDVSAKTDNGNEKIGIYYENGSTVEMFYRDVRLCNGALPAFYQPSNKVTVFKTVLKGNGVELSGSNRRKMVNAIKKRCVPLTLKMNLPVKFKIGSVKTWKIRVKVECDFTVDQLTAKAKIVKKYCSYGLDSWW
ncbi:NDR1/HIN1-like protein 13 [Cicer arietinum]|uniref:Late embryogenesis abundant protein n=1 Tax=Cicer arietinum TaxID=3827 RepID=A0A076KWH6_CICAR|nr:NDR1/HIN1-like protein 13 [Cicer arietinum]AII99861.1 late embryogenesis abundant protein [Cicer arietinum]